MSFLFHALLVALAIALPVTLVTFIFAKHRERVLLVGVALVVGITLIGWFYMWWSQPIVGVSMLGFYQSYWLWFFGYFVAIVAVAAAEIGFDSNPLSDGTSLGIPILVIFAMLFAVFGVAQEAGGIWTSGRAEQLAHEVTVTTEKPGTYPNTDSNHIVIVPENVATREASTAMSNAGSNLSTSYELMVPVLQSVNRHAYWIVAMEPSGFQSYNRVNGTIPGYFVVDAESPDTDVVYKNTDSLGKAIDLHWYPGGWFGMSLERYVWANGFSGSKLDDWTLEVNDQWQPYWTASENRQSLNFYPTVPQQVVTVDANSGQITQYPLDKQPNWLDRIYSADTAKQLVNWWGDYAAGNYGWFSRGSTNRYVVSGDPVLVYTKENYPVWQMLVTSINSDKSVQFLALFDGRTSSVRMYHIDNLSTDDAVIGAIESNGDVKPKQLTPTGLAVHKIFGRLTWVGAMTPNSGTPVMQGVVLVPADQPMSADTIAFGSSMPDALNAYQTLLSSQGNSKPGQDSNGYTATAVRVAEVSPAVVENGTTVFYFMTAGDDHVYRMAVIPTAKGSDLERPFIKAGAKITFSYNDTGSGRRDVTFYDDLGLNSK